MSSGRHLSTSGRSWLPRAASGSSRNAPMAVRAKTRVGGASSRTAMRMKKYGIPQITHMAAKRSHPRLVTIRTSYANTPPATGISTFFNAHNPYQGGVPRLEMGVRADRQAPLFEGFNPEAAGS